MNCRRCGLLIQGVRPWQRRDGRCLPCKREQQNAANSANPELIRQRSRERYARAPAYWSAYAAKHANDPEYKAKRRARRAVAYAIEKGEIKRNPCEVCGSPRAEAHHEDYSQPLNVRWLCKRCHCKADAMLRAREAR